MIFIQAHYTHYNFIFPLVENLKHYSVKKGEEIYSINECFDPVEGREGYKSPRYDIDFTQ